jgi:hypothetical protein
MAYIGKIPTAAALTASDITDGIITNAKLAQDIISADTALAVSPASTDEFLVSDAGVLKRIDYSLISGAFESALLHVRDEKSAGTGGGSFAHGAWRTRVLNTVVTNEITGASLGSNQITLPSGTYYIHAAGMAYTVNSNKMKLTNITDTSDIIIGMQARSDSSANDNTPMSVIGRFTIAAEKVIELQHYCETTRGDVHGFGPNMDISVVEVYADVQIWKVA